MHAVNFKRCGQPADHSLRTAAVFVTASVLYWNSAQALAPAEIQPISQVNVQKLSFCNNFVMATVK